MSTRKQALEIEGRAAAFGLPMSVLLRDIDMSRATWWRWKHDESETKFEAAARVLLEYETGVRKL